jgi:hypothetical protein
MNFDLKRLAVLVLGAGVVLSVLAQLVPYGRGHTNPPVTAEPAWDSPRTREMASRACFDCHSNLTSWPRYSNIAPVSWLVQMDVDQGRRHLNFTEWDRLQRNAGAAPSVVESKEMPPFTYLLMHPEAQLTSDERGALARGLQATAGKGP